MTRIGSLSMAQLAIVVGVLLVGGTVGAVVLDAVPDDPTESPEDDAVSTFDSPEEFRSYLREAEATSGTAGLGDQVQASTARTTSADAPAAEPQAEAGGDDGGSGASVGEQRRASDTNVQIEGIDEPDRLKTTSDTLYYATRQRYVHPTPIPEPTPEGRTVESEPVEAPTEDRSGVHLINASDPAAPEVASRLNVSGRLLLANDSLVVFEGDRLVGYDVADRENPERTWSKSLSDRVVTARLHAGTVYLVTVDGVDRRSPCPIRPMDDVVVPCSSIHHPTEPAPADATYTVTTLDPTDGEASDSASFVGSGGDSVVYVSADSVYVTYQKPLNRADMVAEFLVTNQSDRLDEDTVDRIEEIRGYELSQRSKRFEIQRTIDSWLAGLNDSERREAEQALEDDLQAWAADNKRRFQRTGIVAFDVEGDDTDAPSVEAGATGSVPGRPLNQFSLDERNGEFRIATTVDGAFGTDSENDLYVLDEDLDVTGSVQGMGITERIYSVRYTDDEAYVVTFRRIDPFHVVDLSDAENPTVEGELKLPGFSSYLHPLSEDRILGIGEEGGKVKLVVFDVSEPSNPTVETDRILDQRWSAVGESHHAFLLDRRHGVFFLPAGDTGYVFNYTDGLDVETTVDTDGSARRAAYVGDHLYVFGDSSLTVVDERSWEETTTVSLAE
jgi:inhibitor of cysteine peptidase